MRARSTGRPPPAGSRVRPGVSYLRSNTTVKLANSANNLFFTFPFPPPRYPSCAADRRSAPAARQGSAICLLCRGMFRAVVVALDSVCHSYRYYLQWAVLDQWLGHWAIVQVVS